MFVKFSLWFFGWFFLLMSSCTSFLYYPSPIFFANPQHNNLVVENHTIISFDETKLHAWLLTSPKWKGQKKGLILQYHGNAENLTSHYLSLGWLAHEGFDVFIFDYRGYGRSLGEIDARGISWDSQAAFDYAYNYKMEKKYDKFIVVGQSLGGSVALKTLADVVSKPQSEQVDLVILDSTFRSNSQVAATILRKSWVTFIFSPLAYVVMHDTYNASKNDTIRWPYKTLCITHPKDPVVPSSLTVDLYHDLKNSKKKWLWLRDDIYEGHANGFFTPDGPLNQKLINFLTKEI